MRMYFIKISFCFCEFVGEVVRGNYFDDFFGGLYFDLDLIEYIDV